MKIILNQIIIVVLIITTVYSQGIEKNNTEIEDSVPRYKGIVQSPVIDYSFDELFVPFKFEEQKSNELVTTSAQHLWLRTQLWLKNSNLHGSEATENHFLSPLYNQYLEDSKFDPVRYVLGMAQLSAVGYLAYRHIKKYGFLK